MFIDKSFINELRASLESHMGEEFVAEPYAGSEVAEELLALDDMENMVMASESYAEAIVEGALGFQELALGSAGLSMEEFGKFQDSLGTEAIMEKVKRGGYNVVIAVKKAISKIVKLIFAVFDFFVLADGRWKSYSKLFKKYREKLVKLKPGQTEKQTEKEYSLRNHAEMLRYCQMIRSVFTTMNVTTHIRTLTNGITIRQAANSVCNIVSSLANLALQVGNVGGEERRNVENVLNNIDYTAAAAINTAVDSVQRFFNEGDFKDTLKDLKDQAKDAFSNTHELEAAAAVRELIQTLSDFERVSNRDIRWLKDIKRIQKDIDKAIERYRPEANASDADRDLDNAMIRLFGVLSGGINKCKYIINASVKMANSNMQAVLSDAAKVIAGETRISD